jgi:hypothetical protein
MMYGQYDVTEPSPFINDLPSELLDGHTGYHTQTALASAEYQQTVTWNPYADKIIQFPSKKSKKKKVKTPESTFKAGQQVTHVKFGEGIVVKSIVSQDVEEVEVLFQKHGPKRIDASFLQPKE